MFTGKKYIHLVTYMEVFVISLVSSIKVDRSKLTLKCWILRVTQATASMEKALRKSS